MNRVRQEAARRERAWDETQAAKQRVEAVLQSISDGFVALDLDWRYTAVNDRACESMGMSRDEILGRCIWDIYPVTVGMRFEMELRRTVAEQMPSTFEYFYPPRDAWYENRLDRQRTVSRFSSSRSPSASEPGSGWPPTWPA